MFLGGLFFINFLLFSFVYVEFLKFSPLSDAIFSSKHSV